MGRLVGIDCFLPAALLLRTQTPAFVRAFFRFGEWIQERGSTDALGVALNVRPYTSIEEALNAWRGVQCQLSSGQTRIASTADLSLRTYMCGESSEAKLWLDPVRLAYSSGFRPSDIRRIANIIGDQLVEAWLCLQARDPTNLKSPCDVPRALERWR